MHLALGITKGKNKSPHTSLLISIEISHITPLRASVYKQSLAELSINYSHRICLFLLSHSTVGLTQSLILGAPIITYPKLGDTKGLSALIMSHFKSKLN